MENQWNFRPGKILSLRACPVRTQPYNQPRTSPDSPVWWAEGTDGSNRILCAPVVASLLFYFFVSICNFFHSFSSCWCWSCRWWWWWWWWCCTLIKPLALMKGRGRAAQLWLWTTLPSVTWNANFVFIFISFLYFFVLSNFRIFFTKMFVMFPFDSVCIRADCRVRWKKGARVFNVSHLIMGPPLTWQETWVYSVRKVFKMGLSF